MKLYLFIWIYICVCGKEKSSKGCLAYIIYHIYLYIYIYHTFIWFCIPLRNIVMLKVFLLSKVDVCYIMVGMIRYFQFQTTKVINWNQGILLCNTLYVHYFQLSKVFRIQSECIASHPIHHFIRTCGRPPDTHLAMVHFQCTLKVHMDLQLRLYRYLECHPPPEVCPSCILFLKF